MQGSETELGGPFQEHCLSAVSGASNIKEEHEYGIREVMAREEGLSYNDHVLKTIS